MGITIKRAVRVKVVVTEEFKAQRSAEILASMAKLDEVRKRLGFELESAARRKEGGAETPAEVAERLRAELRRNEQTRVLLRSRLEQLSSLEIGSEFDHGRLAGQVEVNVGDDFSKLASCEIVVKDDRIIEIRDGLCPETGET